MLEAADRVVRSGSLETKFNIERRSAKVECLIAFGLPPKRLNTKSLIELIHEKWVAVMSGKGRGCTTEWTNNGSRLARRIKTSKRV